MVAKMVAHLVWRMAEKTAAYLVELWGWNWAVCWAVRKVAH